MQRGDVVEVRVYGGGLSRRRVWRATENGGVLVCSEVEWQRHLSTGAAPQWVGWPIADVLRVIQSARSAD